MADAIRIVHVDDDPMDAEQIRDVLARDGLICEWTRVATADAFAAALETPPDLILAAHALPSFDGGAALRLARARRPEVPFLFVSGSMGEEVAVHRLQEGATDCVLKQRLERLPAAVRRALREAGERRHRERAEAEVRRLNAELESRVKLRTADLASANADLRRSKAALDDAKAFLEHLLSASPSMVFRFVPDTLSVTYVSPNIGWLLGYSPDEVVGAAGFWQDIVHPEDRDRMHRALADAMRDVVTQVEQECRCRRKDGKYLWFFTLLRIEYDTEAHPAAVLGYVLDIGDRKEAEEQLRQARAFSDSILENLPAMVFVKDARDLRYARFNRAAEETLGLTRDQVIGHTDFDLFPPALAQAYIDKDREVLRLGMVVDIVEEVVATRGHEPRVLHTKKIPIFDAAGQAVYLLGVSQDITEQRAANEEVRLAKLEAERASLAKSEFLSRMSHDLRTPLNAILGFAQILQMEPLAADQVDAVQQILRGGVHLLELINEVLDIARIEAGQLSLSAEPIPAAEVMSQVVELVRPLGAPRGITVSADDGAADVWVVADRQRLKQVLMNLLSNAVKYNRKAGRVHVACERGTDTARILVHDTGVGIPGEKIALVFDPFERLGAEQSSIEGTGLGLAVAKGLTEAMGGRVGVKSVVDVGSTFWVELPLAHAPAPMTSVAVPEAAASDAASAGCILYVEDNRSNVRLLERLLTRRPGVRLITASTGNEALDIVRVDRPDLILLDLHLPDIPGEEVLRRLSADPGTRRIPVAVLSADATATQQQRMIGAGAVAYLTKPLDLRKLLELLDRKLAQHHSGEAHGD